MSAGFGYWGSNIARGGFLARSAADLPGAAADYVDRLVAPYFACACDWYETIGIGVTGGELFDLVQLRLGDPFFGVISTRGTSSTWMSGQVRRSTQAPGSRSGPG